MPCLLLMQHRLAAGELVLLLSRREGQLPPALKPRHNARPPSGVPVSQPTNPTTAATFGVLVSHLPAHTWHALLTLRNLWSLQIQGGLQTVWDAIT